MSGFALIRIISSGGEVVCTFVWGEEVDQPVLSALAPGGGYQSSWGTLLLALGGMNRDAVPGMSINGHQVSV